MKHANDILTVSFDSSLEDEAGLCVSRRIGDQITVLKMELGEQADILYHLLTEQTAKADIKGENPDPTKPDITDYINLLDSLPAERKKELDILYDHWFEKVFGVDPKIFKEEE